VHPSAEWRDAAADASASLSEYMSTLNHSLELYRAIVDLPKLSDFPSWTPEAQRVCAMLQKDMDTQGIGASAEERERIQSLLHRIHDRTHAFVSSLNAVDVNDVSSSGGGRLQLTGWKRPEEISQHISTDWRRHMTIHQREGVITLPIKASEHLLRCLPSAALRQQVYEQFFSPDHQLKQSEALEALILARQELASSLGQPSFSTHIVSQCVAKDDAHVRRVLKGLLQGVQPDANPLAAAEVLSLKHDKWMHVSRGYGSAQCSGQQHMSVH
jgi:Zn-dependent oligopeptidase